MIGIINYGMGNLKSVQNALDFLGIQNKIIDNPKELADCAKLILPGVGAFGQAMENLNNLGFSESIREEVLIRKKPILGICLGMQLLLTNSCEFGFHEGLNLLPGSVKSFDETIKGLPVPHMGWNDVVASNGRTNHEEPPSSFYFVHSYFCALDNPMHVAGKTNYGIEFHSMVEFENIWGAQCHPEKSQKAGLNYFMKFNKF